MISVKKTLYFFCFITDVKLRFFQWLFQNILLILAGLFIHHFMLLKHSK
jgi:hypothetical protein